MTDGDGHWSGEGDYASLPAESQTALQKYDSPLKAIEGGVAAQKMLGGSFRLPDSFDGLDDAQKAELKTKTASLHGGPGNLEGYQFTHAEGVEVDSNMEAGFKQFALDSDMSLENAQGAVTFYNTAMADAKKAAADAQKQIIDDGEKVLDANNWKRGEGGDLGKVQILLANYVTDDPTSEEGKAAIKELTESLDRTGLGSNAPLLLALRKIHGDLVAEGKTFEGSQPIAEKQGGLTYPTMMAALNK